MAKKEDIKKQRHRSILEIMAAKAASFMLVSTRSGAMMPGDYIPITKGISYAGPHTIHGRIKHASETRRVKKNQRRKVYMKSLRG